MALQALADEIPGMKRGMGTGQVVRLSGGFPTVVTNAASISKYTVLDQYIVSPSLALSTVSTSNSAVSNTGLSVATLFDATFYVNFNLTFSVRPTNNTTPYLALYKNTTSMASSTATGMLLAQSPTFTYTTTLTDYYFTSPYTTPSWVQVDMRDTTGHGIVTLQPGDVLSLVLYFDTTGGTLTSATIDGRASVAMETYSCRG